jgi:hypothetical protein
MIDHLFIGPCPADEDCAQTGVTEGAERLNRAECAAYIEALRKVYGPEPENAYFHIKGQSHDFGRYYEVLIYFEDRDEAASAYAFKVESGLATWSEAEMEPPFRYDDRSQLIGLAA